MKVSVTNKRSGAAVFSRRGFLKMTGITALSIPLVGIPDSQSQSITFFFDKRDQLFSSLAVQWAVIELKNALKAHNISVINITDIDQSLQGSLCIAIGNSDSTVMTPLLSEAKISFPSVQEAVGLFSIKTNNRNILAACGKDERGLVYALLELADRLNYSQNPLSALDFKKPVVEHPANEIRSINRMFTSEIEDKPWYYDKEMWPAYLTMLATQRFNRFNLSFGMGYDFLQDVTDGYFVFAYPFLLNVSGYNVRVPQLPDAEQEKNLETLRFISEQASARGLHFQLGLWMHGYEWLNSPNPNYTIEGLNKENHGPYCRDAIRELLKACPAISGVTLRVHGESGVTEGSYEFWRMVFEGVATCGRKVEIDMHSKGMNQQMIDMAVATGMPVVISPKYWAEHMGMPYHQSDIRELEIPKEGQKTMELMTVSQGSRSFLRYGYGDLLKENRPYKVIHRIWSGSRRILLWGDPMTAAAHSHALSFCGSAGSDLMEPLSFKGRRGSGIAGDRCAYSDKSLRTRWDWQKYLYTIRVFGRLQFNPDCDPDVWQRFLVRQFGPSALELEQSLGCVTRILPIVLTAHGASAANNSYWPEIYTNQPIADTSIKHPYGDTPAPKLFGNVSPFDPQLFSRINEFGGEMLKGIRSGKYNPIEAAQWVEDYAREASDHLEKARATIGNSNDPEFRRMEIDITIQAGLGRFFGAKFRAALLYGIYEQSGDREALEQAVKKYKKARDHWASLANTARDVYQSDITAGGQPHLRGHWLDRLPAMDQDIEFIAKKLDKPLTIKKDTKIRQAVAEALGIPYRVKFTVKHIKPDRFITGQPLEISLSLNERAESVSLYYRHVNQGERYQMKLMKADKIGYKAVIPAEYINPEYPLQYYFEIRENAEKACLYPGFNENLDNQPYFVVRKVTMNG